MRLDKSSRPAPSRREGRNWLKKGILAGCLGCASRSSSGGKDVAECATGIAVFRVISGETPLFFCCSRAVFPLLSAAVFRAKGHSHQSVTGNSGREHAIISGAFVLFPGPPARNARSSAASPPGLLQIRCICSKTAIVRRVPPAGTIGTSAGSVRLQIRCKCSRTPLASPPESPRPMPTTGMRSRADVISCATGICRTARCIG